MKKELKQLEDITLELNEYSEINFNKANELKAENTKLREGIESAISGLKLNDMNTLWYLESLLKTDEND